MLKKFSTIIYYNINIIGLFCVLLFNYSKNPISFIVFETPGFLNPISIKTYALVIAENVTPPEWIQHPACMAMRTQERMKPVHMLVSANE